MQVQVQVPDMVPDSTVQQHSIAQEHIRTLVQTRKTNAANNAKTQWRQRHQHKHTQRTKQQTKEKRRKDALATAAASTLAHGWICMAVIVSATHLRA